MKNKNIFLSLIMLLGLLVFTACDDVEGELYQGEADKVGFLAKSTNFDMIGGSIEVPVVRTSTDGELNIPATLTAKLRNPVTGKYYDNPGYTDVFKVAGPVVFAPGESKAYLKVVYSNEGSIAPTGFTTSQDGNDVIASVAFPFALHIDEQFLSPSNVGTTEILGLSKLEFESVGTGFVNGNWAGSIDGVVYEKAVGGTNAYKIINPYNDFNVAFLIKEDGNVVFPKQIIDVHPDYGPVSLEAQSASYNSEAHAVIVEVSGYTVSAGTFGGGIEIFFLPEE